MKHDEKINIPTLPSYRKIRESKMILNYEPEQIFPLLCPVIEYKWFPNWKCALVYSETGIAEKNAIFLTEDGNHNSIVWTVITYEPPSLIEFSVVNGLRTVERFQIKLNEVTKNKTEVIWTVMNTAFSKESIQEVSQLTNEEFALIIEERQKEMDYYLRNGKMIEKEKTNISVE